MTTRAAASRSAVHPRHPSSVCSRYRSGLSLLGAVLGRASSWSSARFLRPKPARAGAAPAGASREGGVLVPLEPHDPTTAVAGVRIRTRSSSWSSRSRCSRSGSASVTKATSGSTTPRARRTTSSPRVRPGRHRSAADPRQHRPTVDQAKARARRPATRNETDVAVRHRRASIGATHVVVTVFPTAPRRTRRRRNSLTASETRCSRPPGSTPRSAAPPRPTSTSPTSSANDSR